MHSIYFIINLSFMKHHTSEQYLNWDSKYALISTLLFSKVKNLNVLLSMVNFLLALLHFQHMEIKIQASVYIVYLFQEAWHNLTPIFCHCLYLLTNFHAYYQKLWDDTYQYSTSYSYFQTNTELMPNHVLNASKAHQG